MSMLDKLKDITNRVLQEQKSQKDLEIERASLESEVQIKVEEIFNYCKLWARKGKNIYSCSLHNDLYLANNSTMELNKTGERLIELLKEQGVRVDISPHFMEPNRYFVLIVGWE